MAKSTGTSDIGPLYIGVDVGTGSVRAALVQQDGTLLSTSSNEIKTWRSPTDHRIFEQSTVDIWDQIRAAVKQCLQDASDKTNSVGDIARRVRGIGFDATCSLAVTDIEGKSVIVTEGSDMGSFGERNIILWADHRAEEEAELINRTGSVVLDYVGGRMSLEMEIPKILWLKKHMSPPLFSRCQFFDLPDYLTYRATGSTARSCCSLSCKCSYVSVVPRSGNLKEEDSTSKGPTAKARSGWDDAFFHSIGLGELVEHGYGQIGAVDPKGEPVLTAGMPVGRGLSKQAAEELGLVEGTAVGSGLIDAYAGWLGTVGARCLKATDTATADGESLETPPSLDESRHRLAVVAGTSTCHIVQSRDGIFVDGIWGPYKDPVFPGWWMNEGGQSATGQLIEHIITTHPSYPVLLARADEEKKNIYEGVVLHDTLESLRATQNVDSFTELTKDLHVYPDFHGNRSPIADPPMRGSITGLDLDTSLSSLALLYHATLTAIALQTRAIIDTLNAKGHTIERIYVSGSQAKNGMLMKLLANTCRGELDTLQGVVIGAGDDGRRIGASAQDVRDKGKGVSAVVLGAAMLGRMAHRMVERARELSARQEEETMEDEEKAEILWGIMTEMTPAGVLIAPDGVRSSDGGSLNANKERRILEAKYQIFLETVQMQKKWREMMQEAVRG